ncbi:galactoside alpha-(1,2)-fucosyltransferase 2-like [Cloeon dipterum]|uniref:galactoside alpha-(1,2)-fucosyltransferase 2-like n=1 Tax=Cloeon dipterum TaxID=197152 RepID=UPI00322044CD
MHYKAYLFSGFAVLCIVYFVCFHQIFKNNSTTLQICIDEYSEEIASFLKISQISSHTELFSTPSNFPSTEAISAEVTNESQTTVSLEQIPDPSSKQREDSINTETHLLQNSATTLLALEETEPNPWKTCPEPGQGPQSTFLSALVDGRLGNVVWSYLSVAMAAKIYNLRPVLTASTVDFLHQSVFEQSSLKIPTIEWLDKKCNMDGWLMNLYLNETTTVLQSKSMLFEEMENMPTDGFKMIKYSFFITNSEQLIPFWRELKNELVLKENLKIAAQIELHRFSKLYQVINRNYSMEYVGVHVRRTDYVHHMNAVHPGSKVASPNFFHHAMNWLLTEREKPLLFVVVSDDRNWTKTNIVDKRFDTFLAGDGNESDPGLDLALLAACNHTIFAYGTFGLTGAMLNSWHGAINIIFDPQNRTVTKEMELASNMPGWRIMDDDGNINYRDTRFNSEFYLHPRIPE